LPAMPARHAAVVASPEATSRARPAPVGATGAGRALLRITLVILPPALVLIGYLALWTAAVRVGQYRNELRAQIRAVRREVDRLEAEARALQSPARILAAAEQLGMERATQVTFVHAHGSRRFARVDPPR